MCRWFCCNLTHIPLGISLGMVLLDHMTDLFLVFLRSLHTVFHSDCTNLHSHQQCIRFLFPLHPHKHLLSFVFLMVVILTGTRWNLNVVLWPGMVSIFFISFLVIWISFVGGFFIFFFRYYFS
jgi:hypothetical protein